MPAGPGHMPPWPTLDECVRAHARDAADAAAVRAEGSTITYGELYAVASAVAAALLERLDDAEEPVVAVAMESSHALVTALVGCWIAGAAFLPLDPQLPAERLARRTACPAPRSLRC